MMLLIQDIHHPFFFQSFVLMPVLSCNIMIHWLSTGKRWKKSPQASIFQIFTASFESFAERFFSKEQLAVFVETPQLAGTLAA